MSTRSSTSSGMSRSRKSGRCSSAGRRVSSCFAARVVGRKRSYPSDATQESVPTAGRCSQTVGRPDSEQTPPSGKNWPIQTWIPMVPPIDGSISNALYIITVIFIVNEDVLFPCAYVSFQSLSLPTFKHSTQPFPDFWPKSSFIAWSAWQNFDSQPIKLYLPR